MAAHAGVARYDVYVMGRDGVFPKASSVTFIEMAYASDEHHLAVGARRAAGINFDW